jgi:hypothetical protein
MTPLPAASRLVDAERAGLRDEDAARPELREAGPVVLLTGGASKELGWARRCKLAHAFRWEDS